MKELSIEEKAKTEKQRVLLTETDGTANIDWDCRSLDDVKVLLKCGLEFIRTIEANKQILTDSRFGGCSLRVPSRYDKDIKQGEQKPADVDYNPFDDFRKSDSEINPSEFDARLNALLKEFESLPKEELVNSLAFYLNVVQNDGTYNEQKPAMIQWKGNNLKEVIDFTGIYKDGFEKWFHNSWEEYEKYVHEHNNIFKIFNKDGSHIEVPVGAWIVKTPDGYNTASRFVFRQKPEWSEEDKDAIAEAIIALEDMYDPDEPERRYAGYTLTFDKAAERLKALRPQSRWIPSEEQMKAMKKAMYDLCGKDEHNTITGLYYELEQLKAL